jgi:hypothetical protein
MKLGDFSSVVQLGVGLHVGTALLQVIVELADAPLSRRLVRLRDLARAKANRDIKYAAYADDASDLLADLEVKRVQFFNEYKEFVLANGGIAVGLCLLLSAIAFEAVWEIPLVVGVFIVAISFGPAPITLCVLWRRWRKNTDDLRRNVSHLEGRILGASH